MSRGRTGALVAVGLVALLAASVGLAAPAGFGVPLHPSGDAPLGGDVTPWIGPDEPRERPNGILPGRASVRLDKNCYFPEEVMTITLRNVGGGHLLYDAVPDFEVRSPVHGVVRMILARWFPMDFLLRPGESYAWAWDQYWQAEDENGTRIHIGEFVPEGEYTVAVRVLMGTTVQTIGQAPLVIGFCDFEVSAGDDGFVDEGTAFRPAPTVDEAGTANLTSVTWDLDPATDANGDGNPTNDADAVGGSPEIVFGDDGVYPVTLNVRGFLPNATIAAHQDVVFTIDSSGSMAWNDPGDLRKAASKSYVDLLVPDDRAAVVDFDTSAVLVGDDPLSTDYVQVKQNIDLIDSFGGTFLSVGLEAALDEFQLHGDPRHAWVMIFLTDAESVTEDDDILVPLAVDRAVALGVRIYAVGLTVPLELRDLMERIANRTGGTFYLAPTAEALLDIYEDIGDEVRKSRGSFFLASDAMTITVRNVAPTLAASADATLTGRANVTLRVAGEKWHDVSMALYRDGTEAGNVSVVRMPGSPDEQAATLDGVALLNGTANVLRLVYTPLDDPVNGEVYGGDPAWVNVTLANGTAYRFHHTFNVRHPATWTWEIDLTTLGIIGSAEVSLAASVQDPGTDDIILTIDWGDGTAETRTYFADGVGPDPLPSPGGSAVDLADVASHAYGATGTYLVLVSVTDDDGGTASLSLAVAIG